MTKLLTEKRLLELAGISEESDGDTKIVSRAELRRDAARRARRQAEKEFFRSGSDDPLVTADVPVSPKDPDPEATQPSSYNPLKRGKFIPSGDERLRPIAMDIFKRNVKPKYDTAELERMYRNDVEVANLIGQLFGWFHPAARDPRGRPTYDHPGRTAVQVAQEFEKKGLDLIDNAKEFNDRIEKLEYESGKEKFKKAVASAGPTADAEVGRSATPGTKEYDYLQDLFKKIDSKASRPVAPTQIIKR